MRRTSCFEWLTTQIEGSSEKVGLLPIASNSFQSRTALDGPRKGPQAIVALFPER